MDEHLLAKIGGTACRNAACESAERSSVRVFVSIKRTKEDFHVITSVLALCAGIALTGETTAPKTQPSPAPAAKTTFKAQPKAHAKASAATQPTTQTPAAKQPEAEKAASKPKLHTVNRPIIANASYKFFPVELAIVEKTNAERVRNGLPALQLDPKLVDTARRHTWWMTRSHSLQHGNYPVAENIAMGQRSTHEVVNCWMNSSGHRANILNRGHRRIGVAAYTTPSGTTYWCQQFSH